jgi:nucleoside-diphosphate-sugar epimerase
MNSNKDLILITGCSGRIGSIVIDRFKNSPYQLIGLDIVPPSTPQPSNFTYLKLDISSDEAVKQVMTEIRRRFGENLASFIHLAAYYNFTGGEWSKYEKITIQGTARLLEAAKGFKTEQFLFSSTMLIHAPIDPPGKINEESPFVMHPWEYPKSKILTEKIIREKSTDFPIVLLRIAGCYDNDCHSIPISNQIQRIYENQFASHVLPGNISHGASYLHLDDMAEVIELCVKKRHELPRETILLVGEEETLSYDQLQNQISQLIRGKSLKTYRLPKWFAKMGAWLQDHMPFMEKSFIKPWMIDYADDNYTLDSTRIKKILDWTPRHSLSKTLPLMIRDLKTDPIKWYKSNNLKIPKNLS